MDWLAILKLVLTLAVLLAQRAKRRDIEKALTNALELSYKERVDRASDAGDDVTSGRVQPDDNDPYRRD